jgi:hypothetical protein
MGTREAPPIPSRPPRSKEYQFPKLEPITIRPDNLSTLLKEKCNEVDKRREIINNILESIANNIHADDMARVEACKVLIGIG